MYYDDEARRFNFLIGLLLGSLLGTGLALIVAPYRNEIAGTLRSGRRRTRRVARGLKPKVRRLVTAR